MSSLSSKGKDCETKCFEKDCITCDSDDQY